MKIRAKHLAIALSAFTASQALGGTVAISQGVGSELLSSGSLTDVTFGSVKHGLSASTLQAAHAAFNADGITTNGKVTFAVTDTTQGLALLVLIDEELGSAGALVSSRLQMSSVVDTAQTSFINDPAAHLSSSLDSGLRSTRGEFAWNSNGSGAGFAWVNLEPGSSLKFQFGQVAGSAGLDAVNTFQFVTWNGSAWKRVELSQQESSFSAEGQFGFSALVAVPLPTTAALAGVSCLGLALRRRR